MGSCIEGKKKPGLKLLKLTLTNFASFKDGCFLYLGHAKAPLMCFDVDRDSPSVFALHPQPCSAHVQQLASTSTVRCMSVYVSSFISLSSILSLASAFQNPFCSSFHIMSGLVALLLKEAFIFRGQLCTDLEVWIPLSIVFCLGDAKWFISISFACLGNHSKAIPPKIVRHCDTCSMQRILSQCLFLAPSFPLRITNKSGPCVLFQSSCPHSLCIDQLLRWCQAGYITALSRSYHQTPPQVAQSHGQSSAMCKSRWSQCWLWWRMQATLHSWKVSKYRCEGKGISCVGDLIMLPIFFFCSIIWWLCHCCWMCCRMQIG